MTEQNTSEITVFKQYIIQTDIPFWKLLLQGGKKGHKLSKPEAFFDLVDRYCTSLLKNGDGCLSGIIPELSKSWGWDRETVNRFLDNLSLIGVLTIDNVANRKAIRLNNIVVKEKPSTTPDVPAERKTTPAADNCPPKP